MGEEAAGETHQGDRNQGKNNSFSETLAPLVGLGDEECGKEDAEVDENAVALGDAQLNRPRPKR
ncbi:MAG TPA: hypothetical protein VEP91_00555 [Solirubrobacterales bacterium]|nr:hypothetical protein [Solirubrobacterales bacterium]